MRFGCRRAVTQSPSLSLMSSWPSICSRARRALVSLTATGFSGASAIGRCVSECGASGASKTLSNAGSTIGAAGRHRVSRRSGRSRDDESVGAHRQRIRAPDENLHIEQNAGLAAAHHNVVDSRKSRRFGGRRAPPHFEHHPRFGVVPPARDFAHRRNHARERDIGQKSQIAQIDAHERDARGANSRATRMKVPSPPMTAASASPPISASRQRPPPRRRAPPPFEKDARVRFRSRPARRPPPIAPPVAAPPPRPRGRACIWRRARPAKTASFNDSIFRRRAFAAVKRNAALDALAPGLAAMAVGIAQRINAAAVFCR